VAVSSRTDTLQHTSGFTQSAPRVGRGRLNVQYLSRTLKVILTFLRVGLLPCGPVNLMLTGPQLYQSQGSLHFSDDVV
jgi:hypothetical protein